MLRLAEYMHELAEVLGEHKYVHFRRLKPGSTVLIHTVEREAAPKVRVRVSLVSRGAGPTEALRAYRTINKLLREDNAVGTLKAGAINIPFPGREEAQEEFTSVRQQGSLDGVVTGVRGKDETVHITLLVEGKQLSGCYTTNRAIAKQLAARFDEPVRLFGRGRWSRDNEGTWALEDFKVDSFEPLDNVPLSSALATLRATPTDWGDSAYADLIATRRGRTGKRNGGH